MSDHVERIPIVEEQVRIDKRLVETERVRVHSYPETGDIVVHEQLLREEVDVVRVPVGVEVAEAPPIRTEGAVTIVPILEERLVVEKRLFVIEELHLRRRATAEEISIPATLRRTRVEVTRQPIDKQEEL